MKATVLYSYFQSRPLQEIHSFSNLDPPRAGFVPEQNLISDSGTNENIQCLVVLIKTTTKIFNFNQDFNFKKITNMEKAEKIYIVRVHSFIYVRSGLVSAAEILKYCHRMTHVECQSAFLFLVFFTNKKSCKF